MSANIKSLWIYGIFYGIPGNSSWYTDTRIKQWKFAASAPLKMKFPFDNFKWMYIIQEMVAVIFDDISSVFGLCTCIC